MAVTLKRGPGRPKGSRNGRKTKSGKAAKAKTVQRTRPLLSPEELKEMEAALRKKFPKIVPGSLRNRGQDPGKDPKFANKRTVEIECAKRGCHEKRRIATSDLHQVTMCVEHTEEARAHRKNELRRKKPK